MTETARSMSTTCNLMTPGIFFAFGKLSAKIGRSQYWVSNSTRSGVYPTGGGDRFPKTGGISSLTNTIMGVLYQGLPPPRDRHIWLGEQKQMMQNVNNRGIYIKW